MSHTLRRVALVGGHWSTNIGNAFYNIGAHWLLAHIGLPVVFLPESPRWKERVEEHYDLISDVDADLFVLVGPCLWDRLTYVYDATFARIYSRGGRVAYLSAGMAHYSATEAAVVGDFLRRYPPMFVSTRDDAAFALLSSVIDAPLHSGLCTSMFLPEAVTPLTVRRRPYVVFNFDNIEPELNIDEDGVATIARPRCKRFPLMIGDKEIIRTINLPVEHGYSRLYKRPNAYYSDLPHGYCSILSSADAVYSERVHTCAAALAYGGVAQFVQVSARSYEKRHLLFERLGAESIRERACRLDMTYIEREKQNMVAFLSSVAAGGYGRQ
jgi:hypothetical protein